MRVLMTILIFASVFGVFSAITGIQTVYSDSRGGTVITYHHGYGRLLALVYAAASAVLFYGIYRRYPFVRKLGLVLLYLSVAHFVLQAWWSLWPQPYGWVGATAVTLF